MKARLLIVGAIVLASGEAGFGQGSPDGGVQNGGRGSGPHSGVGRGGPGQQGGWLGGPGQPGGWQGGPGQRGGGQDGPRPEVGGKGERGGPGQRGGWQGGGQGGPGQRGGGQDGPRPVGGWQGGGAGGPGQQGGGQVGRPGGPGQPGSWHGGGQGGPGQQGGGPGGPGQRGGWQVGGQDGPAQQGGPGQRGGWQGGGAGGARLDGGRRGPQDANETFLTDVPATRGSVILARPTDRAITLSILLRQGGTVRVAYGPAGGAQSGRSAALELASGEPGTLVLQDLRADTAYEYRVLDAWNAPLLPEAGPGRFHTARRPGSAFTFTVQADSHLDSSCLPSVYAACLGNALSDRPDFHIDLGDTFMTGKHPTLASAARQYEAQRHYLGLLGHSAAVFLALGNHDGEETKRPGTGSAGGLAVWSSARRRRLFPNPLPDAFYSGNTGVHPAAGRLENYYAFHWGDALFVTLDPYWTSQSTRGGTEPWGMTLGRAQYDWLAGVLRRSTARHKFVFIHQLVGGLDAGARGGSEAARLFEWGGRDLQGEDLFAQYRPGWGKPIHALLAETGVEIVFHGHDHFYARQALDGVTYQLVPQPSQRNPWGDHAAEYGYKTGDFLPSSGHLRVRVGPDEVGVEYVRAAAGPAMERDGIVNGSVAARYSVRARGTSPR